MSMLRLTSIVFVLPACVIGSACRSTDQAPSATAPALAWPSTNVFPIMPWELPPRSANFADPRTGLQSLADCGFTVAGFVRPEHLNQCERLGLRAIVSRPGQITKWRELSDEQIEQTVRQLVADGRNSPAVIGYFLFDEPGVRDFPALAKAVAAVKRLAPGKLAYINLYPDYATLGAADLSQLGTASYAEYLERYVSEVKPQFISYDNYRVQYSHDLRDANIAASYFDNLLEVRRVAMEHDLPFWNIVSSNRIRPETPPPSPANLLMQAYTTLAAGGRGLTWYTYYGGGYAYAPVDKSGSKTATWSYLKMVNDQVKLVAPRIQTMTSTGVFFAPVAAPTTPQLPATLPKLPGELIEKVDSPTPLMIGEFKGEDGERWAMVVNLSLERSANVQLTPRGEARQLRYVSPADGSMLELEKGNAVWLAAGQGMLVRLR